MSPSYKKGVRAVGVFFLNLLVAAAGTNIVAIPYMPSFDHASKALFWKADFLDAITAFGLGYFVYRKWHTNSAKWLWLAGLIWFGQRAIVALDGRHGAILWEASSQDPMFFDLRTLDNWAGYQSPFVRAVFYSVGASCCSRVEAVWEERGRRTRRSPAPGAVE